MPKTELYGSAGCPFTEEMREWLEWRKREFVEYDVEADPNALARLSDATGGQLTVPVLIEDGKVTQIGWQGRGCVVKPS
ncbi:MAG: Uxx-star family glutaredoxin-like (seleno)protein [Bryobacteraceae bacterium]|jgi:glutaredoxin 3